MLRSVVSSTRSLRSPVSSVRVRVVGRPLARHMLSVTLAVSVAELLMLTMLEQLLQLLKSKGIRVRDFDQVLAGGVLEQSDESLGKAGSAQKLYSGLAVSDQAQIREFYLSKIEEVDSTLRTKYQKLYRYY